MQRWEDIPEEELSRRALGDWHARRAARQDLRTLAWLAVLVAATLAPVVLGLWGGGFL